jgi:hypothetical protein
MDRGHANASARLVVVAETSSSTPSVTGISRSLAVPALSSMPSESCMRPVPSSADTGASVTGGGGSQMRTVWSSEQLANMRGCRGFHATALMQPSPCPDRVSRSLPESRCQMYTFESERPREISCVRREGEAGRTFATAGDKILVYTAEAAPDDIGGMLMPR